MAREFTSTSNMFARATGKTEALVLGEVYKFNEWSFFIYKDKPLGEIAQDPTLIKEVINPNQVFTLLEVYIEHFKHKVYTHIKILSAYNMGWVRLTEEDKEFIERVVETAI